MYETQTPHLPSLPRQPKAKTNSILTLGETTYRKKYQRFGLLPQDRLRHLWILGKTGSGKSTLIANLFAQDLATGQGVALLDPHGDLVETVLPLVPPERTNQVLLLSPADVEYPVSFNIFRQGKHMHPSPALMASEILSVFRKQWATFWGARLEHIFRNAILAVASDPRATLLFLYRFLVEERLRKKIIEQVSDPVVRLFWNKEFANYSKAFQREAMSPVLNKLGAFVSNPVIRNIVGQERSRVDLIKLMNENGILLANLAAGSIGEDASHLLGGLLLSALQLAGNSRERGGASIIIYIDEFQHFVTDSLATMLAESRKFGLGLVLAHQYLTQLPDNLRDAVMGNVGSMILFRLGAQDAKVLAPEFEPVFSAHDMQQLGQYQMAVKILVNGQELVPFSARSLPPVSISDAQNIVEKIRQQSRLRYCQKRKKVEKMIAFDLT